MRWEHGNCRIRLQACSQGQAEAAITVICYQCRYVARLVRWEVQLTSQRPSLRRLPRGQAPLGHQSWYLLAEKVATSCLD